MGFRVQGLGFRCLGLSWGVPWPLQLLFVFFGLEVVVAGDVVLRLEDMWA